MTRFSATRLPIRVQIMGLLVVTQLLAHVLTATVVGLSTPNMRTKQTDYAANLADPLLTALRVTSPGSDREAYAVFSRLADADARFALHNSLQLEDVELSGRIDPDLAQIVQTLIPPVWQNRATITSTGPSPWAWPWSADAALVVSVRLDDGNWVRYASGPHFILRSMPLIVLVPAILLLALPLMLLSIWAGSALVAPITSLARGSERFAADIASPPIPETGPEEVRRASRAFNAMRVRIRKLIDSRSQTLAAIGHDMRTPLTRLRLRLEAMDMGAATRAAEEDIRVLERMIDDALIFLESEQRPLVLGAIDVAVLAQTIVDDFGDTGHRVRYEGPLHLPFVCDHDHIRRVLENTIGNATKYADETLVRVTGEDDGSLTIHVADYGPGIAPEHREHVLEPFSRIESVRNGGESAGKSFGLGLAIARDLVTRHGGFLKLGQNLPEGLLVTISLPGAAAGHPRA